MAAVADANLVLSMSSDGGTKSPSGESLSLTSLTPPGGIDDIDDDDDDDDDDALDRDLDLDDDDDDEEDDEYDEEHDDDDDADHHGYTVESDTRSMMLFRLQQSTSCPPSTTTSPTGSLMTPSAAIHRHTPNHNANSASASLPPGSPPVLAHSMVSRVPLRLGSSAGGSVSATSSAGSTPSATSSTSSVSSVASSTAYTTGSSSTVVRERRRLRTSLPFGTVLQSSSANSATNYTALSSSPPTWPAPEPPVVQLRLMDGAGDGSASGNGHHHHHHRHEKKRRRSASSKTARSRKPSRSRSDESTEGPQLIPSRRDSIAFAGTAADIDIVAMMGAAAAAASSSSSSSGSNNSAAGSNVNSISNPTLSVSVRSLSADDEGRSKRSARRARERKNSLSALERKSLKLSRTSNATGSVLSLFLEKTEFRIGEIIRGMVTLDGGTAAECGLSATMLQTLVELRCVFINSYTAKELWQDKKKLSCALYPMPHTTHEFFFEFTLPPSCSPSFVAEYGSVSYEIYALTTTGLVTSRKTLRIKDRHEPECIAAYHRIPRATESRHVSFNEGKLEIMASLSKAWFSPGEEVVLLTDINNASNRQFDSLEVSIKNVITVGNNEFHNTDYVVTIPASIPPKMKLCRQSAFCIPTNIAYSHIPTSISSGTNFSILHSITIKLHLPWAQRLKLKFPNILIVSSSKLAPPSSTPRVESSSLIVPQKDPSAEHSSNAMITPATPPAWSSLYAASVITSLPARQGWVLMATNETSPSSSLTAVVRRNSGGPSASTSSEVSPRESADASRSDMKQPTSQILVRTQSIPLGRKAVTRSPIQIPISLQASPVVSPMVSPIASRQTSPRLIREDSGKIVISPASSKPPSARRCSSLPASPRKELHRMDNEEISFEVDDDDDDAAAAVLPKELQLLHSALSTLLASKSSDAGSESRQRTDTAGSVAAAAAHNTTSESAPASLANTLTGSLSLSTSSSTISSSIGSSSISSLSGSSTSGIETSGVQLRAKKRSNIMRAGVGKRASIIGVQSLRPSLASMGGTSQSVSASNLSLSRDAQQQLAQQQRDAQVLAQQQRNVGDTISHLQSRCAELKREQETLRKQLQLEQERQERRAHRLKEAFRLELDADEEAESQWLEVHELIAKAGGSSAKIHGASVHGFECAIKTIHIEFPEDAEPVERELRMLEMLPAHPNIVKYLHHTRTPKLIRFYMTRYTRSLAARIQQQKGTSSIGILVPTRDELETQPTNMRLVLSSEFATETAKTPARNYLAPEAIRRCVRDIACGLAQMHKKRVVHGDIKPDNIFIIENEEGAIVRCVIGDLDTAQKLPKGVMGTTIVGTSSYMAPELFQAEGLLTYDFKVDIYALGMLMYELLALEPPYFGIKAYVISKSASTGQLPPLPPYIVLQPEYAQLVSIFRACTDYEPAKRPTAMQLVAMLDLEQSRSAVTS